MDDQSNFDYKVTINSFIQDGTCPQYCDSTVANTDFLTKVQRSEKYI